MTDATRSLGDVRASGLPQQREDVIGKPFVVHYANGWGYWMAPVGDSRRAVTNVYGRPEAAVEEFGLLVKALVGA